MVSTTLEGVADVHSKRRSFAGPQVCLHFEEHFVFLCARKDVKTGIKVEIAEIGFTVAGRPIDEVERWAHADVWNPIIVRLAQVEGHVTVHCIHVRQFSEAKFQVWLEHEARTEEGTEPRFGAEQNQFGIKAKTNASANVEFAGFRFKLQ